MKKIAGISVIVLALIVAIAPMFLDCQSQGKSLTTTTGMTVPMKCHWTGVAMLGAGAPLAVVGGSMFASKRKQTWRALSILGLVLGAVVILMPTVLIGVCANPTMLCNMVMRPLLILCGGLIMALSAFMLVVNERERTVQG
jgi:hypothetical protein